MDNKKFITITNDDGKEYNYEILLTFKWLKNNKNYIVYTDNTTDENGSLNIYGAIYYPNDDSKLDPVETDEEWNEIEKRLKAM